MRDIRVWYFCIKRVGCVTNLDVDWLGLFRTNLYNPNSCFFHVLSYAQVEIPVVLPNQPTMADLGLWVVITS